MESREPGGAASSTRVSPFSNVVVVSPRLRVLVSRTASRGVQTRMSWDDLRILEVLARAGSAPAAARELGVAASTVYRRLAALESTIGGPCIVRGAHDIELTDTGRALVEAARRTGTEVARARQLARDRKQGARGRVGLTTVEAFLPLLEAPLADLAARFPELRVDLTLADSGPSVRRREVEVAIGVMARPPEGLWGKRIARIEFGVFGTAAEATRSPRRWIVCGPPIHHIPEARWEAEHADAIAVATGSRLAMFALLRRGLGVGLIPRSIAALYPELLELEEYRESARSLRRIAWLLIHPEMRADARVRALSKSLSTLAGPTG